MMSQVTLLLTCMLFSKVLSLTCQLCMSLDSCMDTTCSDQCFTMTYAVQNSTVYMKGCSVPELCVSGSINLGTMKITSNAKCCSTDLCNNDTLPALPKQVPNGRKCYTCDNNDCSRILNCEGNEDRCITMSVRSLITMKGCMTKDFVFGKLYNFNTSYGQSCEGNLCNGAGTNTESSSGTNTGTNTGSSSGTSTWSFTLSFLLMLIPLLSSIPFY